MWKLPRKSTAVAVLVTGLAIYLFINSNQGLSVLPIRAQTLAEKHLQLHSLNTRGDALTHEPLDSSSDRLLFEKRSELPLDLTNGNRNGHGYRSEILPDVDVGKRTSNDNRSEILPDKSNGKRIGQEDRFEMQPNVADGNLTSRGNRSELLLDVGDGKMIGYEQHSEVLSDVAEGDRLVKEYLADILPDVANENKLVIMSCVDTGYLEMAINLFESSFKLLGINNYLFIGIDTNICKELTARGIRCVSCNTAIEPNGASNYGSKEFSLKTHFKTKVVLETLLLGYEVIITDADIVFLKNPLERLKNDCVDCDIAISHDGSKGNSGFYLAKPTGPCISLHNRSLEIGLQRGENITNQQALNSVLNKMEKLNEIAITRLSNDSFPNGRDYFTNGHRLFKDEPTWPCEECVIVHNNWIVSEAAKRYRFKEVGLWYVDINRYYSDKFRKYLLFDSGEFKEWSSIRDDKKALFLAMHIGNTLNRTVILPKFSCQNQAVKKSCSLREVCKISKFDTVSKGNYREHSFLLHSLVPENIKSSMSPRVFMTSVLSKFEKMRDACTHSSVVLRIASLDKIDISLALKPYEQYSVLRFACLHSMFSLLAKPNIDIYLGMIAKTINLVM